MDFLSRNEDRVGSTKVPMITAADILELPKGQAFALLEGNRRYKIRVPLADTRGDAFVPPSLAAAASDMKKRYRTSEAWWMEADWLGQQPLDTLSSSAMPVSSRQATTGGDSDAVPLIAEDLSAWVPAESVGGDGVATAHVAEESLS